MKYFLSILLFLNIGLAHAQQEETTVEYQIIPEPCQITYISGIYELKKQVTLAFPSELSGEANFLKNWLFQDFKVESTLQQGGAQADIMLLLDKSLSSDNEEAYKLEVGDKGIIISAQNPVGVLHGIQSLRQIIHKEKDTLTIRNGTIVDYPNFGWRAFMLDEGRYFKGKEVVFQLLDEMSRLKMNVFHWHLTDDQGWRIEIKKYPRLTEIGAFRDSSEINHFGSEIYDGKPHGGFYTQEEIKEIVEYAASKHIMIVPEIEMPGHASAAIAAYPWLGTSGKQIKVPCKFGVQYDVFNVADPHVLQFFEDVMDEVIALFPSPVFHIGGDEVRYNQWNESAMVQEYMKKNNIKTPAELQLFFTNNVSNILASKNRRMMGWNEITGDKIHSYQLEEDKKEMDAQHQLNPKSIVHIWAGNHEELIRKAISRGYDVVNSRNGYTYIDYTYKSIPLKKAYNFDPIPEGLTPEEQKHILGLGCQIWGEFTPNVDRMNWLVYPRIAAYAEVGWTAPEKKDYDRFLQALQPFLTRWEWDRIGYGPVE